MKLYAKTLLIIGCTLSGLIVILYFTARTIVTGGFKRVERNLVDGFFLVENTSTSRNVSRVLDALEDRIKNLSIKAADWAQWDDTYRYIVDHNDAYKESNLTEDALLALRINLVALVNSANQEVFSMAFDLENEEEIEVPQSFKKYLSGGSFLLNHASDTDFTAGVILLPENPLMIVSRPILKSDMSGPSRGSFIFARFLDPMEFDDIASVTHTVIEHRIMGKDEFPQDFQKAQSRINDTDRVYITPLDQDTIAGYAFIRDIQNRPVVCIRVAMPRQIHHQGMKTLAAINQRGRVILASLVISIIVTGVVLCAVILFTLDRFILKRLSVLSEKAVQIGTHGNFSARVLEHGHDEISSLAASMNHMLDNLAATHNEIGKRNADMQLLMNTVPIGLLSIDERNCINPQYSKSVVSILENNELSGRKFTDILALSEEQAATLSNFFEVYHETPLSDKDMAGLNPFEELAYQCNTASKWLRIRYFIIRKRIGTPHHILAVIEDITEEKKMQEQIARSQRENLQLKAIAENPDLFREFLFESKQILCRIKEQSAALYANTGDCHSAVREIFKGVHTIKGIAGSFGLDNIAEITSYIEDLLFPISEITALTGGVIQKIQKSIRKLEHAFLEVIEHTRKIMGDDIELSDIYLRVSLKELNSHLKAIREMTIEEPLKSAMILKIKEEIIRRLKNLKYVPARKGLARSLKIIPGLIQRLEKDAQFTFEGQDEPIDYEVAYELNTPLVHLLRNAFDHGIENKEERFLKGKGIPGRVSLSVKRNNGSYVIKLSDDGKGIDPEKLKQRALKNGLISGSEAQHLSCSELHDLIFRPGFSTADTVTYVSGRGVGMDVVADSVKNKLHGTICVESTIDVGTTFCITIPG